MTTTQEILTRWAAMHDTNAANEEREAAQATTTRKRNACLRHAKMHREQAALSRARLACGGKGL
jgi:hypothetical protein